MGNTEIFAKKQIFSRKKIFSYFLVVLGILGKRKKFAKDLVENKPY